MLRHACGYALARKGHDKRAIQDWLATISPRGPCNFSRVRNPSAAQAAGRVRWNIEEGEERCRSKTRSFSPN